MDDQIYRSLQAQINELRNEVNSLRAHSGLDLMTAGRGWQDEFGGDSLNPIWFADITGTGVAAAIQATSPDRALLNTGATINSQSGLTENALYKWSASIGFMMLAIAKMNNTASITFAPCALARVLGTDEVGIFHDTTVPTNGFVLRSTAAGVTSTSGIILDADTEYHTFALSVRTGVARARIDGGVLVELLTNIPTVDMQVSERVVNRTGASRTMELDYFRIIPGVNIF